MEKRRGSAGRRRLGPFAILLLMGLSAGCGGLTSDRGVPEEVIRFNIRGTAYLGQQKWAEAETEFLRALELRSHDPLLLNNLAVAKIQQGQIEQAREMLQRALAQQADEPYAQYNLGLIDKNEGAFEDAARHFEIVARADPDDLLTQYHLGVVLSRVDRQAEAVQAFRRALELDPAHVSSLYGLGRLLLQSGDAEEGARLIGRSQEIRSRSGLDAAVGSQYGEQGPYAMGADYPGDALTAPPAIPVVFHPAGRAEIPGRGSGLPAAALTRVPDGAALLVASGSRLNRLDGAAGWSSPAMGGLPAGAMLRGLAAGDVDGDGRPELVVVADAGGETTVILLRGSERDGYLRVSEPAFDPPELARLRAPPQGVAIKLVDGDHDGDVDVFWCWTAGEGGEPPPGCRFGTNDAQGHFTVTPGAQHGVAPGAGATGPLTVGFTDWDNDRDIDLLVAAADGIGLFSNQRDGTFEDVSARVGLGAAATGFTRVAAADVNKDGWMDLVAGGTQGVRMLENRRGTFESVEAFGSEGGPGGAFAVIDHDNDGFLDLVRDSSNGMRLFRNLGQGRWEEQASPLAGAEVSATASPLAAFDADRDGDEDLAVADGLALVWLRNDGGDANRWIALDSRGVADNRLAFGTKVEVLAGALRQKFEITDGAPLHVGLGNRDRVETARYLWPSGVLQDELDLRAGSTAEIDQLDRKGTSCPLLYAWRDGGWRFVTDFLGGAAVGYRHADGSLNVPDTDEYVKIEGGLQPDARGDVRVRFNNQLEEVLWFDHVELLAVDHPAGTELFPNERLMPGPPWPRFELFASADVRPILSARDPDRGVDLTDLLRDLDRRYAAEFEPLPFKGYAGLHRVELDLGPWPAAERAVLLLDGWIDYADSTSNLAAAQAGAPLVPPRLLVANGRGGWIETRDRMGFPAGLPKTMAVDLSGLFPGGDHRVRIETTMRLYWDRVRVLIGGEDLDLQIRRLPVRTAELRYGGFPRETSPDGRKPFGYDPNDVDATSTWKAHEGAYTAFGGVTPLLEALDDRFVTTRNGDEIELRFAAPAPPPAGRVRTWLLFADGFGKDMDPNSAASSTVGPVPFHGMPDYPYADDVAPPRPEAEEDATARPMRRVAPSDRGWPGARPPLAARLESADAD